MTGADERLLFEIVQFVDVRDQLLGILFLTNLRAIPVE